MSKQTIEPSSVIAFIGGGNMAQAIVGGLLKQGVYESAQICVVEPLEETALKLKQTFGVQVFDSVIAAQTVFNHVQMVVWAVKPQVFKEASATSLGFRLQPLHLSVMAGITLATLGKALQTNRVVRAMPNTPALIGKGITGLYAGAAVSSEDRALIDGVLGVTGRLQWLESEESLDAVTALSGSGPAYVFYFLEAMVQAGKEMGLSESAARGLATETFKGGAALADAALDTDLSTLRERVTSKGGTTYAALTSMEESGVKDAFVKALHAAKNRATELGRDFV